MTHLTSKRLQFGNKSRTCNCDQIPNSIQEFGLSADNQITVFTSNG